VGEWAGLGAGACESGAGKGERNEGNDVLRWFKHAKTRLVVICGLDFRTNK